MLSEGVWLWEQSGQPFNFTAWSPGEPSNAYGTEHFMELYVESDGDITWNDLEDYHQRSVVCEIQLH